jgi:broad specificity phosphatase PhoE
LSSPAQSVDLLTGPVIVLVRHAEKGPGPDKDPPLTPAGAQRAQDLRVALRNAGVTAIITTQYRRTKETAQPLADAQGIKPREISVDPDDLASHVDAVTAFVRRQMAGVLLIVGHDNTVPALIGALGGPQLPDLCASSFGHLFVLFLISGKLVQTHYGAADPPGGPGCL